MDYLYKSITKKGKEKNINEDAIGILEMKEGVLCIVCDGLSGGVAASKASRFCVDSIKEYFINSQEKNILSRIFRSINNANSELCELSLTKKKYEGMATTSEVFFINNHTVYWGHTGDSRIYNLKNNKLYQLTKDHSLVQQMLDRGYISMRAAKKYPNKNVITNALGDGYDIEIDSSKLILNRNDKHRFMICSDGVNAVIKNKELEKILKLEKIEDCITELDQKIQLRGAPDDYSIIIIELA
jgi:protein phosphatase